MPYCFVKLLSIKFTKNMVVQEYRFSMISLRHTQTLRWTTRREKTQRGRQYNL